MPKLTAHDLAGPDPNPMSHAEVNALKQLMDEWLSEVPTIIQIGAERGCSTVAMLEARPLAFILSIDMGPRPEEKNNLVKAGLDPRKAVRALGRSQDIGFYWPLHWDCEMLFIDGDHRYEGVKGDIAQWIEKVQHNGLIVFHDYIEDPQPPIKGRVARAVDEWISRDPRKQVLRCERLIAFQA